MKSLFMIYALSTWPEHLSNSFHRSLEITIQKKMWWKYSKIAHAFCTRLCGDFGRHIIYCYPTRLRSGSQEIYTLSHCC